VHQTYGPIPLKTFLKTNESISKKFRYESSSYMHAMATSQ